MKAIRDRKKLKTVTSIVLQSKNKIYQTGSVIQKNIKSMGEEEQNQKDDKNQKSFSEKIPRLDSIANRSFSHLKNMDFEKNLKSNSDSKNFQKNMKNYSGNFSNTEQKNFSVKQKKEILSVQKNPYPESVWKSSAIGKDLEKGVPRKQDPNYLQKKRIVTVSSKNLQEKNKKQVSKNSTESPSYKSENGSKNIPQNWGITEKKNLGKTEKDFLAKTNSNIKKSSVKALTKGQSIILNSSGMTLGTGNFLTVTNKTIAVSGVATAGTTTAIAASGAFLKNTVEHIKKIKEQLKSTESIQIKNKEKTKGIIWKKREDGNFYEKEKFLLPIICFFLILVFPVYFLLLVGAAYSDPGNLASGNGGTIIEVAQKEAEEINIGGTKYKTWYGMNDNWCAMFVSWCAEQCGYLESGIMPKAASVSVMRDWYISKNRYQTKESGYEPNPGDIIIFKNGRSHVGIVKEYNPETKIITTLEGNTGSSGRVPYHTGSRVKECTYPLHNSTISGYGIPDYPQQTEQITEEVAEDAD